MNELINQRIIVVDDISNEFCLYYPLGRCNQKQNRKFKKFFYFIQVSDSLLKQYGLSLFDLNQINSIIRKEIEYENEIDEIQYKLEWHKINNPFSSNSELINKHHQRLHYLESYIERGVFNNYIKEMIYGESNHLIINYIYTKIYQGDIPERYTPKIEELNDGFRLFRISFNNAIISLMIQKDLDKSIIDFFIKLTKDNGIGFDEYIDNWAKRLLSQLPCPK